MPPDPPPDTLREYLLGRLDEPTAQALEARYVVDEALLDEIADAEQDLVRDFVADRLTSSDRERFEAHYLASPLHRARVATARALAPHLEAHARAAVVSIETRRRRHWSAGAWRGPLLAAAALVLAALIWFVARQQTAAPVQQARQPADAPAAPAPGPPGAAPSTPDQVAQTPAPAPAAPGTPDAARSPEKAARPLLAVTLSAIVTRGEQQRSVALPATPGDLLLQLEGAPEPGDTRYLVELQTVEGVVVWSGRTRPAAPGTGRLANVRVPTDDLEPNDYVVAVFALEGSERTDRERFPLRLRAR